MRIIGLDLGTKTLGVAMSDVTGTIASTFDTFRFEEGNSESVFPEIKKIVIAYDVCEIVLGLPKNMNNTLGPRCEATMEFKEKLESYLNIQISLQDERLSTVAAHNYMLEADMSRAKRKQKVDQLAANIILQTYLDRVKGR